MQRVCQAIARSRFNQGFNDANHLDQRQISDRRSFWAAQGPQLSHRTAESSRSVNNTRMPPHSSSTARLITVLRLPIQPAAVDAQARCRARSFDSRS